MKIGIIGLGRMGNGIADRLVQAGHEVFGFDLSSTMQQEARDRGVVVVESIKELAFQVRVFWLMVPVGEPVDQTIKELIPHVKAGDIVIDGGNSKYIDSIERAKLLALHDIFFLDCGTSGGLHGRQDGYCLMVGGDKAAYTKIHELLAVIAAPGGLAHVGPSGAGHYVKMVHNGIEYALLQAYAEGFQLLKEGSFKESALDLEEISRMWSSGSIIRSWILELAHDVFVRDQKLENISGEIGELGTGRWMAEEAHARNIPVPALDAALKVRTESRETGGNYASKVVAMLRHAFGGHAVKQIKGK
jgi:6-phosphogluconate dehydrogenase